VLNTLNVPNNTANAFSARTLILTNFDFNPTVTYSLLSQTGFYNIDLVGQPIIQGQTNLRSVTVGGSLLGVASGGPSNVSPIAGTSNVYSLQR
jgi:hypothetical protein